MRVVQQRKTTMSNMEQALWQALCQLESLQSAQLENQHQLAEAERRTADLEATQEEARKQAAAVRQSAVEAQAKSAEQVRKLQADEKQLQEHIKEVEGKVGNLESELSELRNKLKAEKEQAQEARRTLVREQAARAHKAAVCKLTTDFAEARAAAVEQQVLSSKLAKQLGESSAQVLSLSRDLTSAQEAHSSAVQALQVEVTQLKEQVCQSKEVATATKAQMRQLEVELGQTASSLVTTTENLAAAKTTHLQAVQALEGEVSQLKEQASRSEASSAATKVQIRQLEGKLGHASSSLVTVTEDLATAKTTHSQSIQVMNAEIAALTDRNARLEEAVQQLSQQQQAVCNNPHVDNQAGEARTSSGGQMKTECVDLIAAHYTKGDKVARDTSQAQPQAVRVVPNATDSTHICSESTNKKPYADKHQVCDAELKAARASSGVDSVACVADLASPVGMTPTPKSCNLMAKDTAARALAPAGAVDDAAPASAQAHPAGMEAVTTAATDLNPPSPKAPPALGQSKSKEKKSKSKAKKAASSGTGSRVDGTEGTAAMALPPAGTLNDEAQASDLAPPAASSPNTTAAIEPTPAPQETCEAEDAAARALAPAGAVGGAAPASDLAHPAGMEPITTAANEPSHTSGKEVQHTWKLKMREQRTALEAAEKALGGAEKSSAPGRYGKAPLPFSPPCPSAPHAPKVAPHLAPQPPPPGRRRRGQATRAPLNCAGSGPSAPRPRPGVPPPPPPPRPRDAFTSHPLPEHGPATAPPGVPLRGPAGCMGVAPVALPPYMLPQQAGMWGMPHPAYRT
ncbi:hypothetical protein ABBQ38_012686 [Trebouxia sp. C0009 RCD-2024]